MFHSIPHFPLLFPERTTNCIFAIQANQICRCFHDIFLNKRDTTACITFMTIIVTTVHSMKDTIKDNHINNHFLNQVSVHANRIILITTSNIKTTTNSIQILIQRILMEDITVLIFRCIILKGYVSFFVTICNVKNECMKNRK